jgi:hypothetical protein
MFQKNACAFFRRQKRDQVFNRFADPQSARLNWRDRVRHSCSLLALAPHSLVPQEINAAIMGDPKQPRLQRPALVELFQLPIGISNTL